MKRIFLNLLAVMLLLTYRPATAQYSGGSGTAEEPFRIASVSDLDEMSMSPADWDAHFIMTQDIDAAETRNRLNEEEDTIGFMPIGYDVANDMYFRGYFDGQGHTISNLYINRPEMENVGLFGRVGAYYTQATVKNLNLSNAFVVGKEKVGALIGHADNQIMEDCHAEATVKGIRDVGGLVGSARGYFLNCSAAGDVSAEMIAGGFTGTTGNHGDFDYNFELCHSSAKVSVTGTSYPRAGGFAGELKASAKMCYATGDVSGTECVGGFAGYLYASGETLAFSFATGKVIGSKSKIGGFVGEQSSSTIKQCYATGEVSAAPETTVSNMGAFGGAYSSSSWAKREANYYNADKAGVSDNAPDGVSGLTNTAFAEASNFTEWNFSSEWEMTVLSDISMETRPYHRGLIYDFFVDYSVTIADAGEVTGDFGWFHSGETLALTATAANAPYQFKGWYSADTLASTELTLNTPVTDNAHYVAYYYAPYSGGDGSEQDPYQLSTLADIQLLAATVFDYDKHFILTNDIDAAATKNIKDEYGDTIGFTPIGNADHFFTGTFNGQGYTISNLYINRPLSQYVGLFGRTDKGTHLQNINLENVDITAYERVAGLAGYFNSGLIENCHVQGRVYGDSDVALMSGYFLNSDMNNSSSAGEVTGTKLYAGGLIARCSAGDIVMCHSSATVRGYRYAGGFTANGGSNIRDCYATGAVSGREAVGGFIGYSGGTITACFATGRVSQTDLGAATNTDPYGYTGGFVGDLGNGRHEYCYATGKVYGITSYGGFYGGYSYYRYYKPEGCVYDLTTTEQPDQNREGVTALTTEEFAEAANYPEWNWEMDWELGDLPELDSHTRPYQKPLMGWDYIISASVENPLAGEVSSDVELGWFKNGDEITLTATINSPGYEFDGWYINDTSLVSSEAVFTFSADADAAYVAKHTKAPLSFAGGNGSPFDPYQISTLEHLLLLGQRIDDLSKRFFVLINDIDASETETMNNGKGFAPIGARIGYTDYEFEGNLDGQGYTISRLYINRPDEEKVGLFKDINGTVMNLHIAEASITGGEDSHSVGALAANAQKASLIMHSSVRNSKITGAGNVGAMLGSVFSQTWGYNRAIAKIANSYTDGNTVVGIEKVGGIAGSVQGEIVSCYAADSIVGEKYVGGLVGQFQGYSGQRFPIVSSYTQSSVSGKTVVGGLIGYLGNHGIIEKSYSLSTVNAKNGEGSEDGYFAGGLVGEIYEGSVSDSYALGKVSALDRSGGFLGKAAKKATIKRCYAAPAMSVEGMFAAGFVFEIAGANCEIIDSYFDTELTGFEEGVFEDVSDLTSITAWTTTQMSEVENFPAFDFAGVWNIDVDLEIDEYARPYLKWQNSASEVYITAVPEDAGIVSGEGWYNLGDEVSISSTALIGWKLKAWLIKKDTLSTEDAFTFTIEADSIFNIKAIFEEHFSAEGEGTENNPYRITSLTHLEELNNLPQLWDKHFILMNDIDATDTKDWNVSDHDNSIQTPNEAAGFKPIGDDEDAGMRDKIPFTGSFNGQGHKISKLFINRPAESNVGFFGYIKGAKIKNLTIESPNITAGNYTGGLIGSSYSESYKIPELVSYIDSCKVTRHSISGALQAGGLAGSLYFCNVNHSSAQHGYLTAINNVGGFAGELAIEAVVNHSFSSGTVMANGQNVGGFAGRIVGYCEIDSAYAATNVNGAKNVGGFVGLQNNGGNITNSHALGKVHANGLYGLVGGFVGAQYYANISRCYAKGAVSSIDIFAGGFVGYTEGGGNTSIEQSYATGTVKGRRFTGGFAGQLDSYVKYCYATGEVDASVDDPVNLDIQLGGFAGRVGSNAYVGNSFTLSDVKGHIYVGGFTGVNFGVIEYCYSAGEVTGSGANPAAFVAFANDEDDESYIKSCYYDQSLTDLNGIAVGTGDANALSTDDFADKANMDFNFSGIWHITINEEHDQHQRPYLKWEKNGAFLAVTSNKDASARVSGGGWYDLGEKVELVVREIQSGLKFSHWERSGAQMSSENPYIFSYTGEADSIYTAVLVEDNTIAKGDGSSENPYQISSMDELVCLSNLTSIWDKHFILTGDIDATTSRHLNNGKGLSPIGVNDSVKFTGTFDGQHFSILGLYINRQTSLNAQALFGHVGDTAKNATKAIIRNLKLDSIGVGGTFGVGSLVGDMVNTEINNCHAIGYVLGSQNYIGGLAGRSRDGSQIIDCSYSGNVYSRSNIYATATGGLVGYSRNTLIERCYAITDSVVTVGESVGGLIGFQHDSESGESQHVEATFGVKQSFAISNKVSSGGDNLGGLIGANKGAFVEECYAATALEQKNFMSRYIGGLVGDNLNGSVTDSYFDKDKEGIRVNESGLGIGTDKFSQENMFPTWDFGNDWKMAVVNGDKRPILTAVPTYTVTFKAKGKGKLLVEGEAEPETEQTDIVVLGAPSRYVEAYPDPEADFVKWRTEDGVLWETESTKTYIPADKGRNVVLIAEFKDKFSNLNENEVKDFKTYPNPTDDILYVEGVRAGSKIRFFDISGNLVYLVHYEQGKGIDIRHLNSGVYFAVVEDISLKTMILKQ